MRRIEREITDIQVIESVIADAEVCRVAFADNNVPYIVTMNFGFLPGETNLLYFHCAPEGRKIEMLRRNSYVCFQMDTDHMLYRGSSACDWGMKYKSVVGYGTIAIVTDESERKRAMDLLMYHYGAKGVYNYSEKVMARTAILRLAIKEMTGKQA